jgi:Tfp pilus assembly protein PilZ
MSDQNQAPKNCNAIISKLFQIVVNLTEEQQLTLLRHAEDFYAAEKRVAMRKTCDIPVSYATDCRVFSNDIKNISDSGLFIETQKPLIVGDEIVMSFRLEGFDKPFKMKGDITRTTSKGVGVEFKNISPYIREMIDLLLKRMG